jgi:sterol desaturase/sphingolipid hydroxylase (fatty acid hydroxylase superfamily)
MKKKPTSRHSAVQRQAGWRDVGGFLKNGQVPALLLSAPLSLAAWLGHALMPGAVLDAVARWPLWLRVAAGVAVGEVGFYWGHRLTHAIPFLWRFHAVHHSEEEIYFLTSARSHPVDNAFTRLCGLVPCYILGVANPLTPSGSLVPTLIIIATIAWGFFIHANLKLRLGALEWIIATPGFHHWHHTRSAHKDKNFAPMLPMVDWLFGTLHLPDEWPADYGVEQRLPAGLTAQMLYPLRAPAEAPAPLPAE